MDPILFSLLPLLVPFAFLLYYSLRTVKCPDCGERLPPFISPFRKTRRMWRAGGYLCAECGCETNLAGQKVTADTPPPPFPTLQCVTLAVLSLVGIGLITISLSWQTAVAAPLTVAAPPMVELPLQAPDVAPVN